MARRASRGVPQPGARSLLDTRGGQDATNTMRVMVAVLALVVPALCHAQDIAPVRPGLVSVPMPALDNLDPVVADQMRAQRLAFDGVAVRTNVSDRDLAAAYYTLGRLCHAYEFFDAAEASYANAIKLAPQDGSSLHLLGFLYQQTGRFDEAIARYDAARRAKSNDAVVRAHLAEVYLHVNRLVDARELFEELVDIYPAVARAGLGQIARREGRFGESAERLEAALARAPNAAPVYYSLGMAYRGLGRLERAREYLERRVTGDLYPADSLVESLATLLRGERAQ